MLTTRRRALRLDSAHLLATFAIVVALAAPAGAALVTAKGIANNAVQSRHIRNGSVTGVDLKARTITNKQLGIGSVKAPNLASGSIGAAQVADGSLTGADLVDGSVTAFDLAPGTVGSSALAAGSITGSLLADGSVSTDDLADGAITSGKIADGAVTGSKLGSLSVTSAKLADGAVTSAKFATGSVDEAAIGAGAVDSIELANGAVGASHMSAGSVTGPALGTVTGVGIRTALPTNAPHDGVFPNDETDGVEVVFGSEVFDTSSMWAAAAPTDVIVPTTGLYQVQAWVDWDADNDGYREAQLVVDSVIEAQERRQSSSGATGNRTNMTLGALVAADAGDVINVRISHGALNDLAAHVRLTAHRVGTV